MIAVAVAMRIMRTSWWGPRDVGTKSQVVQAPVLLAWSVSLFDLRLKAVMLRQEDYWHQIPSAGALPT